MNIIVIHKYTHTSTAPMYFTVPYHTILWYTSHWMKCMSDNSATHSQQCVHGRHIDGIINFTNYLIQNHYTEILWFFMSMACDRVRIMFSHHIKFYIRRLLICFTKRANECEQACCSIKKKRSELTFRHFITSWYVAKYPYISTTLHLFYDISIRFDSNIEIVWHLFLK